jgi:AcrR family transcriptional regulator
MSREDSRELTTQRLLDAGQKLIAKKGLDATSVENITAAAGYSRGAFYSNFSSKDDLFIELLRRDHQRATDEFNALRDDSLPMEQIQARTVELYSQLWRDNECFMMWTEARMLAARDAKFRARLNALMAEKRDRIAGFIGYFYGRLGVAPPEPPEIMAMGFMSLAEGVKLAMLSSPTDMTQPVAESVLALFAAAITQAAMMKARSTDRRR